MTRMNPLRRLAATAAVIGVTGFGAVALASPAMADPGGATVDAAASVPPAGVVVLPALDRMTVGDLMGSLNQAGGMTIQSPLPDGPVVVGIANFTLTYTPEAAQTVQTVIANFYGGLGYQVAFSKKNVLVIGDKVCDPSKSATWNQGCINPDTSARF